jgi:hypothetical protein
MASIMALRWSFSTRWESPSPRAPAICLDLCARRRDLSTPGSNPRAGLHARQVAATTAGLPANAEQAGMLWASQRLFMPVFNGASMAAPLTDLLQAGGGIS